jgi:hypothetical protein
MAEVTPTARGESRADQPHQPGQRINGAEPSHHGRHRAEDRTENSAVSIDARPVAGESKTKPVDGLIEAHSFKRRGSRAADEFADGTVLA